MSLSYRQSIHYTCELFDISFNFVSSGDKPIETRVRLVFACFSVILFRKYFLLYWPLYYVIWHIFSVVILVLLLKYLFNNNDTNEMLLRIFQQLEYLILKLAWAISCWNWLPFYLLFFIMPNGNYFSLWMFTLWIEEGLFATIQLRKFISTILINECIIHFLSVAFFMIRINWWLHYKRLALKINTSTLDHYIKWYLVLFVSISTSYC